MEQIMEKERDKKKAFQTLAGAAELADHITGFFANNKELQEKFFTVLGYATEMMLSRMAAVEGIDSDKLSKNYCSFLNNVHEHVEEIMSVPTDPENLPN